MTCPVRKVLKTFLYKYFLVGIIGGILGFFGGVLSGILFGSILEGAYIWFGSEPAQLFYLFLLAAIGSSILAVIAGWIPALVATQQDPAEILHKE